jgi:hypothetical protein
LTVAAALVPPLSAGLRRDGRDAHATTNLRQLVAALGGSPAAEVIETQDR